MPTLPNPGMSFTPFDPLPAADLNDMVENIEAIANLSVFADGDIPRNLVANLGDGEYDYVQTGIIWTADAAGSTLLASMTAGTVYINGLKVPVAAVNNRAFTASRDTYIDIGVDGVVDYNPQTNNSASPALAANHIRVGIIVTGATNIAAAASVNQGQEDRILPIASSIAYATVDSLGNRICPRDKSRKLLGMKQLYATAGVASATAAQVTGLTIPIKIPGTAPRRVRITLDVSCVYNLTSGGQTRLVVYDGAVGAGTLLGVSINVGATGGVVTDGATVFKKTITLAAGDHTLNLGLRNNGTGTATIEAGALDLTAFVMPAQFMAELV